jgi:hypothetical protein
VRQAVVTARFSQIRAPDAATLFEKSELIKARSRGTIQMSELVDDRASSAASHDRWGLIAVLALWAGLLSVICSCIALYGRNLPLSEDWEMVPAITGHEPNLLAWLWTHVNEHRVPLQKAIYLLLLKASGGDFRIGGIANTIILGGLALAMILTARQLRGCTRPADGFLPLALLHPGNLVNFVFGFQIQLVVSAALIALWLLIIVRTRWPLSPPIAIAACTIVLLLPLSGANGFLFTPFVVLWMVMGTRLYPTPAPAAWIAQFRRACVIISIALVGLSFVGHQSQVTPPYAGFGAIMIRGIRFVGMGIGEIGTGKASSQLIRAIYRIWRQEAYSAERFLCCWPRALSRCDPGFATCARRTVHGSSGF